LRQFSSSGFRIWNLGREAKLVYTGFGIFSLLAFLCSFLLYDDLVGARTAGVAGYYAGTAPARSDGAPAGGAPSVMPRIELPAGDEAAPKLTVAIPYRKLLEVTHFHLFTVPVFLLIIAHLFMQTGLSPGAKAAWIVGGWLASLGHLAAPWAIRYGSASLSVLYPLSGAAMGVTMTVMTVYPIVVMWAGGERKRAGEG
jgi:hypothetical protein